MTGLPPFYSFTFYPLHSLAKLASSSPRVPSTPGWQDVPISRAIAAKGNYLILRPTPLNCDRNWTELDFYSYFLFGNKGTSSGWGSRTSSKQRRLDLLRAASQWKDDSSRFYIFHRSLQHPISFPPCITERQLFLFLTNRFWPLVGIPTPTLRLPCPHFPLQEDGTTSEGIAPFW